jgi:hypothetical protein
MEMLADNIAGIISDYQNEEGIQLTGKNVLDWVRQFEEADQQFIMEEFYHLLNQGIYVSRSTAKTMLFEHIQYRANQWKYSNLTDFLNDTSFLNMQKEGKSQPTLLSLLREVLQEYNLISYNEGVIKGVKNYIYLDDILATGNTIFYDCAAFLSEISENDKRFADLIISGKIRFGISVFCCQSWGLANTQWRLMKTFEDKIKDKISFLWNYEIQNHPSFAKQLFNHIYPQLPQPSNVTVYLESLQAEKYGDKAFRGINKPVIENFFSSPENRIRFENIILQKGLQIIADIKNQSSPGLRPLGFTSPSHKILGLGTLFFTWRNIPNNCPLVFWWKVPGHSFCGLFPLKGRGN